MSPKLKKNKIIDIPELNKADSYKSLIYGIVTVAVLFVIVIFGVRILSGQQKGEITKEAVETAASEEAAEQAQAQGKKYVVAEGDTLWSISEKFYSNGFQWKEIAKANNISNPGNIEKGLAINIPEAKKDSLVGKDDNKIEQSQEVGIEQTVLITNKITGNSYTVKPGDDLWDIAIRAYGDGFKWKEIAKANNLVNPDIIHSGNVLNLPR